MKLFKKILCMQELSVYGCIVFVLLVNFICHQALADTPETDFSTLGRINLMEENDYFTSKDDRHYTQGVRLSYLTSPITPDGSWDQSYGLLSDNFPIFQGTDRERKYEWTVLGQSLFTPQNTTLINPSLKQRPYAAWLYTGTSLLQETNYKNYETLENLELLVGVVGPAALGKATQNDYHQFINVTPALGWKNEIKNEPGLVATYERKWRIEQPLIGNLAIDAIPEMGATVGNFMTYAETGGMVRFGQNLAADYGADRIRPSLSGTGWFNPNKLDGDLGWYVFLGTQERIMGRNIFLDGNSFQQSPSVGKKTFVEDFMTGASLFWSTKARVDLTVTYRTREFYNQQGAPDRFGGINFVFGI